MLEFLTELPKKMGRALMPIKNFDASTLVQMARSPVQTKHLLDKKQAAIVYLDDTGEADIVGGIRFSNIVLNPSLGKGGMAWITSKKATWLLKRKNPMFICHPRIPYALEVGENAYHSNSQISKEKRAELGLPVDMEQLLPETLSSLVITKWQTGFDERPGNLIIFIFGFATGGIVMTIAIFLLLVILGAVTRK